MTIKQTAYILKIGFLLKYFSKKQIGYWADKKISEGCENFLILEVSFIESKSDSEALSLISSLIGETDITDKELLDQYYLGFFRVLLLLHETECKWINIEKEVLRYYSTENYFVNDEQKLFISILNNDFSLRQKGLSGVMQMPSHLVNFLNPYPKFYELQEQLEREGLPRLSVACLATK